MSTIQKVGKVAGQIDQMAELIRDPAAAGPVGSIVGNAGRRFCDAFSNAEVLRGDEPGAQLPLVGLGRAAAGLVCGPYLAGGGFDPPQIGPPPFPGGQCPTTYVFTWRQRTRDSAFAPWRWTDPIQDFPIGPISIGLAVPEEQPDPGGGLVATNAALFDGQGNQVRILALGGADIAPGWELISLSRFDGAADDCGDAPGEFEPGNNPAPSPGPFPPGQEPGIDPTGQPFFFVPPIQTPFGELPVDGDYFGDEFPPAPPAGGDGLPGDGQAIGGEAGAVSGGADGSDIDFGSPPEGRSWVGCIVEMQVDSRLGNIPGTGPSNTVYPQTLGNVALNYGAFSGSNVRLLARFTEVFRPVTSLIVTGCFLQTQIGASAKVFPISAPTCPENPCEE